MVSKVQLANMALDILAVDNIVSIDEASAAARKVKTRIDGAIDAVLEMSNWTFARKVAALAEVDNLDWTERYERKYNLPSDMIKAVKLVPALDIPNDYPIAYDLMNGALYTDEAEARLRYIYRHTDTTAWPMSFTETVAAYLARALAMPLTRKRANFIDADALLARYLADAVQYDASQEVTFWPHASGYLEARGASRTSGDSQGVDGSSYWGS